MKLEQLDEYDEKSLPIANRTRTYLMPSLLGHGDAFKTGLSNFNFVAAGLWDENHKDKFPDYSIGFLINAKKSKKLNFDIPHLVDHYYFGELIYGKLHMLVIELPEVHKKAWTHFQKGEYSKMYDHPKALFGGLRSKFAKEIKDKCIKVCTKDPKYRAFLEYELSGDTGVTLPENAELDSKPDFYNEIFNYNEKT